MIYTFSLSNILRRKIIEKFENVSRFCNKTGIPYMTVQGVLKRGVENTTVSTLQRICDALNITITDLFKMRSILTIQDKLDKDPNYTDNDLIEDLLSEKIIRDKIYTSEELKTIAKNYRYFASDDWL